MVEATSSLPPIRYWVDVILTTVAVSAVRLRTRSSCLRASLCPLPNAEAVVAYAYAPEGRETIFDWSEAEASQSCRTERTSQ